MDGYRSMRSPRSIPNTFCPSFSSWACAPSIKRYVFMEWKFECISLMWRIVTSLMLLPPHLDDFQIPSLVLTVVNLWCTLIEDHVFRRYEFVFAHDAWWRLKFFLHSIGEYPPRTYPVNGSSLSMIIILRVYFLETFAIVLVNLMKMAHENETKTHSLVVTVDDDHKHPT